MTRIPIRWTTPRPEAASRQPSSRWLIGTAFALLAGPFAGAAQAATITVSEQTPGVGNAYDGDDELCSLLGAIANANTDSQDGDRGCEAGSGADTIVLPKGATFTLTEANNESIGPNGLPLISSVIRIEGNGSTIARSASAPRFRFFQVGNFSASGNLTLDRVTLTGGSIANSGGAIYVVSGLDSVTLTRSTVRDSRSDQNGGGIYGGGGVLSISDSTLSGNRAAFSGGGLFITGVSPVTLSNVTVSGNSAEFTGGGLSASANVTLNHVTIAGNAVTSTSSGQGGGFNVVATKTVTLSNSIVAGNVNANTNRNGNGTEVYASAGMGPMPGGVVNAGSANLFGHGGLTTAQALANFTAPAGQIVATADSNTPTSLGSILELGNDSLPVLKDNGGATRTVALVTGSPAINASIGNATTKDQRGFAASGVRDIGAFELDGVSPAPTVTALSPGSGPAAGGTRVTITGTNFGSVTGPFVKFGSANATGVTRLNATTIEANSPRGTGTVNVTVTTDEGSSADDGTADDFTYQSDISGACGSANDMDMATAPVENLCTTGTATAVTGSNDAWRWSCTGSGSGSTTTCAASYAMPTITLTANPTSITVGGDGSTVFASSTSGLKPQLLSFTSSVCSVNPTAGDPAGTTVTATGIAAGTCTVFATLAGTGDAGVFRYRTADDESVDITVAKGAQTITGFATGKTTLKVGEMTTLSATGGESGNEVSFKSLSSEICFVSGAMVTALSTGTCTVAADQGGNDGYNAATQATINITVAKAAQLISGFTAHPASLKVGGMTTLSASGGASGNSISFSSSTSEVCSVSGAMVTALSAGTCTVIASQAGNADFEAADEVSLNVPVNKAAQLISGFTANPSTIKVGQTSQLSAFGGASGKPITFSSTTDTCSVSGSTVTALAVGSCTVTASQAGNADFDAAETAMLNIGIEAAEVVTAPALALDMNDLDFGTGYLLRFRDIGVETTSEAEVVTLSNTGTAPLAISSIVTTGDFRHTTTCGTTVAPGATCTISIRFSPKAVGTRTGETRITSNAVTSPDLIRLSGTGKGLQPGIRTNVSSFNFGRVKVGAASRDQTLVISSTGSGPLEIRNITVTGDYTGSHNCPRFLDAGKSCQVTGRFRPRATGVRPGAVSILTSVSSTPTQVTLTGTGTSGGTVN